MPDGLQSLLSRATTWIFICLASLTLIFSCLESTTRIADGKNFRCSAIRRNKFPFSLSAFQSGVFLSWCICPIHRYLFFLKSLRWSILPFICLKLVSVPPIHLSLTNGISNSLAVFSVKSLGFFLVPTNKITFLSLPSFLANSLAESIFFFVFPNQKSPPRFLIRKYTASFWDSGWSANSPSVFRLSTSL